MSSESTSGFGRFLTLDLTTSETGELRVDPAEVRRYLGGGGIGAKLFVDQGDDDALVIANGLLTGLPVTTACKTSFLFRSPLTGIFGESSVGGKWGAELAKAGVSGLILTGRSPHPVTLYIQDGRVEVLDAQAIWGMDTFAAHGALAEALPRGARIGVIGTAGVGLVRYASVMFEGEFPRAAGRTGVGCRFGAMNLKGIAVKGADAPVPADRTALKAFVRTVNKRSRERAAGLVRFGTAGGVPKREKSGDLPVRNFSRGSWTGAEKISGQAYTAQMKPRSHACAMCPIACAKRVTLGSGHVAAQPEYETAGSLGSNLLVDDPEGLAQLNETCNRLGLDTISAGVVVGFLFECIDQGIVDRAAAGLGPQTPTWGSTDTVQGLLERIARRDGIGAVLADGVRAAAEAFGGSSERFAIHVKGLELPMHDPRALVSAGATYATGNRGGMPWRWRRLLRGGGDAQGGDGLPGAPGPPRLHREGRRDRRHAGPLRGVRRPRSLQVPDGRRRGHRRPRTLRAPVYGLGPLATGPAGGRRPGLHPEAAVQPMPRPGPRRGPAAAPHRRGGP